MFMCIYVKSKLICIHIYIYTVSVCKECNTILRDSLISTMWAHNHIYDYTQYIEYGI